MELIERLKAADGPNYALDCAISEILLPDEWFGSKVESWFGHGTGLYGCNTADGIRHLDCQRAGKFTVSVDAAMSLIPADCQWTLESDAAWVRWMEGDRVREAQWGFNGRGGKSTALAICIAALYARDRQPFYMKAAMPDIAHLQAIADELETAPGRK